MKKINYFMLSMISIVMFVCFLIISCVNNEDTKEVGEKTYEETTPSSFVVGSNESSIVVSGAATVIAKVTVKLTILHDSTDDLKLTIESPVGTQVLLSNKRRGDSGDSFIDTVFDDSASTSIADPSNVSPFTGTFKPEQLLSAFNGEDANGTWKLLIVDDQSNGSFRRELSNWSLTISD